MSKPDRHQMTRSALYPSGAQEWHCPICERRMVMQHEPGKDALKIVVLQEGDRLVPHFGSTVGVEFKGLATADSESASDQSGPPAGYLTH